MHVLISLTSEEEEEAAKLLRAAIDAQQEEPKRFSFPSDQKSTLQEVRKVDPDEPLLVVTDSTGLWPLQVRLSRQDMEATAPTYFLALNSLSWAREHGCQLFWQLTGHSLVDLPKLLSDIPGTWNEIQEWVYEKQNAGYLIQTVMAPARTARK